jgi:hypothetical protein
MRRIVKERAAGAISPQQGKYRGASEGNNFGRPRRINKKSSVCDVAADNDRNGYRQ